VLEEATTYQEALRLLSETPIPCDCLLLLSGTVPGELAVIERTPTRYSLRGPKAGNVCVTNGYLSLDAGLGNTPSGVLATSCQRFNRIQALIADRPPVNAEDCLDYLSDPEVRMNMTVQQMVFVAATGKYWTRTPGSPPPRHNPIDLH